MNRVENVELGNRIFKTRQLFVSKNQTSGIQEDTARQTLMIAYLILTFLHQLFS